MINLIKLEITQYECTKGFLKLDIVIKGTAIVHNIAKTNKRQFGNRNFFLY